MHPAAFARRAALCTFAVWCCPAAAALAADPVRPVAVRVQWGGGQARAWGGTVRIEPSETSAEAPTWRTLCVDADAASMVHEDEAGTLQVHQPRPVANDGVEILLPDLEARLVVELGPTHGRTAASIETVAADLLERPVQIPLDGEGNRLTIRPAAGESLRVTIEGVSGDRVADDAPPVCRPGGRVRLAVDPLLPVKGDGSPVELRMRLKSPGNAADLAAQNTVLTPMAGDDTTRARHVRFQQVVLDIALPGSEGVFEVELEAVERGSLRWNRSLASRTVQLLAVADAAPPPGPAEWRVVHELDPGSPKLLERLRRMPGVGLPSMPRPGVGLPAVTLPRLPQVPALTGSIPAVPQLSSMVPRIGGLLAVGHSRVEPTLLGPMLRLPPAVGPEPTWEGILIAGVQPGVPHAVEIVFPNDQDADVAVSVLETDGAGMSVLQQHDGGFSVRRDSSLGETPRLETHRFVFWPTTRHPLLVIANPSSGGPALFGRVRVSAGPSRLPRGEKRPTGRGVHAFMPRPDLPGFAGPLRVTGDAGRPVADWRTHFDAIRHSADFLASRSIAGAIVPVYAEGGALWPSRRTRQAARWDPGRSVGDSALDIGGKDVLEALCRVYAREGLRLIPGLVFDAPLPELEAILARGGSDTVGIVCLGRDGRPRRIDPGSGPGQHHYNLLDPRVQQAVAGLVEELAGRLESAPGVDGVALVLGHEGWLHLPGLAWCLDDATFGRFVEATGLPIPREAGPEAPERFAARAILVEGSLREDWIEWRNAEMARFLKELAGIVTSGHDSRSLWVVPTTLLAAGDLATRFRPILSPRRQGGPGAEVFQEIGLDPRSITGDPRVVFVAPHARGGRGNATGGGVTAANIAAASAAAAATRRATVLVELPQPLSLTGVLPHAPFGDAAPAGDMRALAVATGAARTRSLAESLVAADGERVFDMSLTLAHPSVEPPSLAAVGSLPPAPLAGGGERMPLIVRSRIVGEETWVQVVNAAAAAGRGSWVVNGDDSVGRSPSGPQSLPPQPSGAMSVELAPWEVQVVRIAGRARVESATIGYGGGVAEEVTERIASLRRRRASLEAPLPVDLLDNPGFELGPAIEPGQRASAIPGWELLEPRRGSLFTVTGIAAAGTRALAFGSANGLATLRSNPFGRPASGRLSVAAWLRIREGDPQPPLRIALEGVEHDREFYRFAAVGGLTGGRSLTAEWSQFVLQVDDLPESGLDSLRVRFDLLGPGRVEIDEVRVFDLAFDESQRVQLSRMVTLLEQQLADGDIGGCVVDLQGYWPRYLEAFVPDAPPAAARVEGSEATRVDRAGVLERVRRLWQ